MYKVTESLDTLLAEGVQRKYDVQLLARIDEETMQSLDHLAEQHRVTKAHLVRVALRLLISRLGG